VATRRLGSRRLTRAAPTTHGDDLAAVAQPRDGPTVDVGANHFQSFVLEKPKADRTEMEICAANTR
jgi:hypothetical protein